MLLLLPVRRLSALVIHGVNPAVWIVAEGSYGGVDVMRWQYELEHGGGR